MKSRIFLYLFLFAVLYIIFQYANAKKTFEMQEAEISSLKEKVEELEQVNDSLQNASSKASLEDGYSLESDDKAKMYVEELGYNVDEFKAKLESEIFSKNKAADNNELVPFAGMNGGFMRINDLRIINHRWVIIEFTDGTYWGQALVNYFIEEDGSLSYEVGDGFLYPN